MQLTLTWRLSNNIHRDMHSKVTLLFPRASFGSEFKLTPRLGRTPGGGNGNPLQYSSLENSMGRESWRVQSIGSQGVMESDITE